MLTSDVFDLNESSFKGRTAMQYLYSTPKGNVRVVFSDGIRNDRRVSSHFKTPVKYLSHKGLGTCDTFTTIKGGKSAKFDRLVIKFEKAQLKVPKGYVEYIQRPEVYDFDVLEDFGINRKDVGEYLGVGKVHKKKKLIICK